MISIVVPVYNAEAFLPETIQYVKQQTYTDWELLLVDDCSTDGGFAYTCEEAKKDERIRPIRQERNAGAAQARNRGIREAKGEIICFLDADDIWMPDKLEKELAFMQEKKAGFVFTSYEFADASGTGLGKIVQVPETITYKQALKNTTIFTSTVMLDCRLIKKEDMYMPDIASEDTATWWHLLKTYGAACGFGENLVKYRRSSHTLSSNKMVAIKRIWNLYRKQERFSVIKSAWCMCFWAVRAVLRRM